MNYKKIVNSNLFVFILFLLIFYSIFRYSESFNKGYNIVEDHAYILSDIALDTTSFTSVYEDQLKTEFKGHKRFRPVWLLYFLTSVQIFGYNLLLLNIFISILGICTAFFLYKFCKNIGFSAVQSFLFALLTLIGPATIMYSRPPDSEIFGMFMLSLTLFFLSKSIFSEKKSDFI